MAQGEGGGRIRRAAVPQLRIVGGTEEHQLPNPTATGRVRPSAPLAPADLPEAGRELFHALAAELDAAGLVAQVDAPMLALAIRAYLLAVEASDEVLRDGSVSTGSMGQPVSHPGLAAFAQQAKVFADLGRSLGLSFGSRARIPVPEAPADVLDRGSPFAAQN